MKFHPSNPRQIDRYAKAKLKRIIQKRGYLGGIVWNERTQHLVAGHQRISVIDELEGSQNYGLEVDIINVDPKHEKELLVALNNESSQGTWDVDKLASLIPEMDLSIVGFDQLDIENLFPDRADEFASLFADERESPAVLADVAELERMRQQEIERQKAEKKRFKQQGNNDDDTHIMIHLLFGTSDEATCFAEFAGINPDDAYPDGRMVVNGTGGSWDELWADWCKRNKPETA